LNLIENAKRYAGEGAQIKVHAKVAGDLVAVQVLDDGPGIPEDEWDKVFEKFYRGRGVGKADGGVGLGLTICRAIIRAHGGRISIQPRNAGGTIVEFTLPAAQSIGLDELTEDDKLAS
jgi:two-component system sensor histidine kinase KdpD